MTVRAKLTLVSVTQHSFNPNTRTLKFTAQYDQSIPEDLRFQKATPSGQAEMTVDNPAALAKFEIGLRYYVDFTPAEPVPGEASRIS